jgi:protein-disulfide isomerase
MVLVFLAAAGVLGGPAPIRAEMQWRTFNPLDLKAQPIDLAASPDGQKLFVLTPGQVLVYGFKEAKIIGTTAVDKDCDRIAALPGGNGVAVSSSARKTLQMLTFEMIYAIDTDTSPFKGLATAPVTIVVFDDYQCGYCAGLEPLLRQVTDAYPQQVKLVIKQFPLSSHSFARKAATAALAAANQGKFWEMHTRLFQNQKELSDAKLEAIAGEIGLNLEQFRRDLQDGAIAAQIDRDLNSGNLANVRGTPTIFVNGKPLAQRSLEGFQQAIAAELQKSK